MTKQLGQAERVLQDSKRSALYRDMSAKTYGGIKDFRAESFSSL